MNREPWRALRQIQPPPESRRRVLQALEAKRRSRRVWRIGAPALATAAVLAALGGSRLFFQSSAGSRAAGDSVAQQHAARPAPAARSLPPANVDDARVVQHGADLSADPSTPPPGSLELVPPSVGITELVGSARDVAGTESALSSKAAVTDAAKPATATAAERRSSGLPVRRSKPRSQDRHFAGSAERRRARAQRGVIDLSRSPASGAKESIATKGTHITQTANAARHTRNPVSTTTKDSATGPGTTVGSLRLEVIAFRRARAATNDAAVAAWHRFIERWPHSPLGREAHMELIAALRKLGQRAALQRARREFATAYPGESGASGQR